MFGLALLLGVAGSLHCAGMCGPLVLAIPYGSRPVMGRWVYHLGRFAIYGCIGALFGVVGHSLALAGLQRSLSISGGLILIAAALAGGRRRLASPMVRVVSRLKSVFGRLLMRRTLSAMFALGILNGLLPCGLVYVAATAAAATGGIGDAAAYMVVFGLGTLPMLLGLGLARRLAPFSWMLFGQRWLPGLVALLGALLIFRGLSLGIPFLSPNLAAGACCR